jgi:hypothetical protein
MQKTTHQKVKTNDLEKKEPPKGNSTTQQQNSKVELEERLRCFAKLLVNIYLFNQ